MSAQKSRKSGPGWRLSDKPAALSGSPSATGLMPHVGRCGNRCRQIIANERCYTAIIGQVTPMCCLRNVFIRSAKTLAKPPISSVLTIRYANAVPISSEKRSHSAKIAQSMNAEFGCLLIILMQQYQFKLNHYHFLKCGDFGEYLVSHCYSGFAQ